MQIAQVRQQAYQEALAQAHLNRVQGLAVKSEADAVRAHADAQDASARALSTVASTVIGASQDPLQRASLQAGLLERQANAAKAEAELQGKVFDNELKRARFAETSPNEL